MSFYCAFLGHQPHISLAELSAVIRDIKSLKLWTPSIATFETEEDLNQAWLNRMGGTMLIAREISNAETQAITSMKKLEGAIPHLLYTQVQKVKKKATFSFRCMGMPRSTIRSLYRSCKKYLKTKNIHSRYIGNERSPAKPGSLMLRGIPGDQSCEIVILHNQKSNQTWIGTTCAVHDVGSYTMRDMEKPFRDTQTGLLPPKLAQIMINLGRSLLSVDKAKEELTLWDPFCGSGVIALEALHRHIGVLASDISLKAVNGCKKNIEWLRKQEKTPKAIISTTWKHDALKPYSLETKPDFIVTETTLGPPLLAPPTKQILKRNQREADDIEIGFFKNLKELLPDTPVVCTFPVYVTKDGSRHFLPRSLDAIQRIGYRLVAPRSKRIVLTERMTLLYLRPDQLVGREIVCFLPEHSSTKKKSSVPPTPVKPKKKTTSKKKPIRKISHSAKSMKRNSAKPKKKTSPKKANRPALKKKIKALRTKKRTVRTVTKRTKPKKVARASKKRSAPRKKKVQKRAQKKRIR